MIQMGSPRHMLFEAAIYNRDVRAAVKNNRSHALLDDYWADVQMHDVIAHNEFEALTLLADRFPPDQGFVVAQVTQARRAA